MNSKTLISWIGTADINASKGTQEVELGPIGQAVTKRQFDNIVLLNNFNQKIGSKYIDWIIQKAEANVSILNVTLSSPTNFGEIYKTASKTIADLVQQFSEGCQFSIHLSPGTPAMAAVWILITKSQYPEIELIESSIEHGVKTVTIPFDVSADFVPDFLKKPDLKLEQLAAGLPELGSEFDDLIHRSNIMKRVVLKARRIAIRSIPVLIEGESGTGKEVLARAIHQASPRSHNPFIAVNCGAIPSELVESELFGSVKGAFTGADKSRKGYFEAAEGGTLFLDEIGELPKMAQVKLLRTLQEKRINRVGETKTLKIDVRIISATNRNLIEEVQTGNIREDLYYRLAVATLTLPPLRDRGEDVGLLIDKLMDQINIEASLEPGFEHKKLSASAKNMLLKHPWPGNVRELQNTLTRAGVWSPISVITEEDIQEALLPAVKKTIGSDGVLYRSLDDGVDLPEIMSTVACHYLERALKRTNNNKTQTSKILGLSSYQTLTNWLKKYRLE
jgi:DNA-binding NtrC family response regulator